jgi:hypothetical protein
MAVAAYEPRRRPSPTAKEAHVTLDLSEEQGTPLERQEFTLRELVPEPISKLNDDAFTRLRVIWMNGVEQNANRIQHVYARHSAALREPLARVRRIEQHQQTLVNWLLPADQSPLETTLGYEQAAIEVTAAIAEREPDEYLAQVNRFGMLEDFDHLYRFSALIDRLEGKDPNNVLQCYTDILPGRPTAVEHRHPEDDLRISYARQTADPRSKLHAHTIVCGEHQVRDYYMNIGPLFADPVARELYAEIASIEEQHVTQYESLIDPSQTLLESWLLHEATEVFNYYACVESESNPRIKVIWERFLNYELGQLHFVRELFERLENRDPYEVIPRSLEKPLIYQSHRDFVRSVLQNEAGLRASGHAIVRDEPLASPSRHYRQHFLAHGSASERVASGYVWTPGSEVVLKSGADDSSKLQEVSP